MSIHGICHDEGMAGHCGLECRGFTNSECTMPEEVLENAGNNLDGELKEHYGEIQLYVLLAIPGTNKTELIKEMYGY